MTVVDQVGRSVSIPTQPRRIVSLVPSITELLVDLHLEDELIGITKFCVQPYRLKSTKTIVGGTKNVREAKVAALQPDFIIANKEENTEEIVRNMGQIGPVFVSDIATLDDNLNLIRQFGTIFNRRTHADRLISKIEYEASLFDDYILQQPHLKAAYFIWKKPYMVAGSNTFINHMMQRCRLNNIFATRGRYPEIEIKKLRLEGDPEVILLSSEPYPFKDEDAFEIGRFTHHAKVVFVDGEMFSWYGSRPAKAFQYFRKLREQLA